jgi:hypothetical protein
LGEEAVDLACHVGGISADVEEGTLFEQLVDFGGILLKLVLDVDLLRTIARECDVNVELVAEIGFVLLQGKKLAGTFCRIEE